MKDPQFTYPTNHGFTLIELMISIALIAFLSSVGLYSLNNLNRRQVVTQTTKKIAQDIRLAQSLANNNQKPDISCDELIGYRFRLESPSIYVIESYCLFEGESIADEYKEEGVSVNMSGIGSILFKVLNQGVEFSGGDTLTISQFNQLTYINVNSAGNINVY